MPVIIEDPEGNIQLGIDNENPYVKQEDEPLTIIVDQMSITMERPRLEAAIRLHKLMSIVKFMAIADFVLNFLSFTLTYYWFYLIATFCSLVGYKGVITYNKNYILFYIIYQILQTLGKIYVSVYVLSYHSRYSTSQLILAPTFASLQVVCYICVQTLYFSLPT